MRNGERLIGEPARNAVSLPQDSIPRSQWEDKFFIYAFHHFFLQYQGLKKPNSAYWFIGDLLGRTVDNPQVEKFKKNFPYYEIEGHPENNMVIFKHDE